MICNDYDDDLELSNNMNDDNVMSIDLNNDDVIIRNDEDNDDVDVASWEYEFRLPGSNTNNDPVSNDKDNEVGANVK